MKLLSAAFAAAAFAAAGHSHAQSPEDLLKKHGCVTCHAIDKKIVGPAYIDVATKYRGDAKAPAMLMEKVKKGSVGTWGPAMMPPNPTVPDADVKILVTHILSLKK